MTKIKIAVLGAGNMGTAMAQLIAQNGYKVNLWNYEGDPDSLRQIKKYRENKKYLSGVKLTARLRPVPDLAAALSGAAVVFFVLPSNFMAPLVKRSAAFLPDGAVCVDASKGLDEKSLGLIPDVFKKNLAKSWRGQLATISGPAIAREMVSGGFTAMSVASVSSRAVKLIKKVLENDNLKLVATKDMVGVEVAGSFKNVYAIAMGLCDGLKKPMNTKAALLVLALREISVLVKKMGGLSQTVYGLAGLGDLVGTGLCAISRNRRFGEFLANGFTVKEASKKVGQTVEGARAAKVLMALGKKYRLKMFFAEMVYRVVWKNKKPAVELKSFLKSYA